MTPLAHTIVQVLALAVMVAGLYLLSGLPAAMFAGGVCALVASCLSEFAGPPRCDRRHVDDKAGA